jgi:hypothetical protein
MVVPRSPLRSRYAYAVLLAATVVAGLGSREFPELLPVFVARYAGDTLWATMVFWLLALAWPAAPTRAVAVAALAISVTVEVSQLYHAPWIDAIRSSRLGALVLGEGFLWSDLACYAAGTLVAMALDRWIRSRET